MKCGQMIKQSDSKECQHIGGAAVAAEALPPSSSYTFLSSWCSHLAQALFMYTQTYIHTRTHEHTNGVFVLLMLANKELVWKKRFRHINKGHLRDWNTNYGSFSRDCFAHVLLLLYFLLSSFFFLLSSYRMMSKMSSMNIPFGITCSNQ